MSYGKNQKTSALNIPSANSDFMPYIHPSKNPGVCIKREKEVRKREKGVEKEKKIER